MDLDLARRVAAAAGVAAPASPSTAPKAQEGTAHGAAGDSQAALRESLTVGQLLEERASVLSKLAIVASENAQLRTLTSDLLFCNQLNPNGVFRTDHSGTVIYANQHWFAMTGIDALGPQCDRWLERVHPDDAAGVSSDWQRALQDPGHSFAQEFRFQRPDGTITIWIQGTSIASWGAGAPTAAAVTAPPATWGARLLPPEMMAGPAVFAQSLAGVVVLASAATVAPAGVKKHEVLGSFTDVSDRILIERERVAAMTAMAVVQRQRADDAELHRREQERFVDVICHEIRNPLNGIVNNLELVRSGRTRMRQQLEEAQRTGLAPALSASLLAQLEEEEGMLHAIALCGIHQKHIADDVLDVSRLRVGRLTHLQREFWVDELLESTLRIFRAEAATNGIELGWTAGGQRLAHTRVRSDPHRITQIVVNLLSNALKFTAAAPRKHVHLAVAFRPMEAPALAEETVLVISVKDTGIGMTASELDALFVPFAQANIHTHATYGGYGMGLFITKELAQLLNGRIRVESRVGVGSTFTLELPTTVVPEPMTAPRLAGRDHQPSAGTGPNFHANPTASQRATRTFTILVVDDNEINRMVLSRQLKAVPNDVFDVVTASHGGEAVQAVTSTPASRAIDLVFMDVEMPVMDGLDATRRIRAHEAAQVTSKPSVPIVGISGNARQEHIDLALASGMTEYVVKPYDRVSLLALVNRVLGVTQEQMVQGGAVDLSV